jgi:hypothetical protein
VKRKAAPNAGRARLSVLATGDEKKYRQLVSDMLMSTKRLDREAALEALVERPAPELRPQLRALYLDLDEDGLKADQGGMQRLHIINILREIRDSRDADVGVRATDTYEKVFGDDSTWKLRARGLVLLAEIAPDVFPYYAVEHLDDMAGPDESEPAGTAFQLLAGTGNHVALYQWLLRTPDSGAAERVFELFVEGAPPEIVGRYATESLATAIKREDDALCTVLAESIVRLELGACYPALSSLMTARISDELYAYVAVLLAGTNRPPLLSILEEQLHRGRRPKLVVEALRVRTTPEQQAILKRWEEE